MVGSNMQHNHKEESTLATPVTPRTPPRKSFTPSITWAPKKPQANRHLDIQKQTDLEAGPSTPRRPARVVQRQQEHRVAQSSATTRKSAATKRGKATNKTKLLRDQKDRFYRLFM